MFEVIVWQPLGLLTTVKPLALPGRYDRVQWSAVGIWCAGEVKSSSCQEVYPGRWGLRETVEFFSSATHLLLLGISLSH